jgi:hypothetical protein
MLSVLEIVPQNILCHIAYLSAASSLLGSPHSILQLLLTSRTIYHCLAPPSCPQLYANLFRITFDTAAVIRRLRSPHVLTASALSGELVRRHRMLRRVRHRDMSSQNMAEDLFAAHMMLLESDGLNEIQLAAANFSDYISAIVRIRLGHNISDDSPAAEIDSLAVWSLWLTLSRRGSLISSDLIQRDFFL